MRPNFLRALFASGLLLAGSVGTSAFDGTVVFSIRLPNRYPSAPEGHSTLNPGFKLLGLGGGAFF
jgi:hypothetical protein